MNRTLYREAVLVQPPFVQLNCPYPAIYYLRSFIKKLEVPVQVMDHSIGLFEKIFSSDGLEIIFSAAEADVSRTKYQPQALFNIERFFSEKNLWIATISRLINFLRGSDYEWGHLISLVNGSVPSGPRFDSCIQKYEGEIETDKAKFLATALLSDLADFIKVTLDSGFDLIRYASLPQNNSSGFTDFAEVKKNCSGFIMEEFYRPYLNDVWKSLKVQTPFMLGITIPFPGCLTGALVCSSSAKEYFGDNVFCVAGGGYVNTELRFTKQEIYKDYFDSLVFDRGYSFIQSVLAPDADVTDKKTKEINDNAARTVFPDYSDVDFSRYIMAVDNANPMHRLWSDGRWLKAYLAHGCYWHSCKFCDGTLDYIKNYIPVNTDDFFFHFKSQVEKTGICGVHLVDEAAPPSSLLQLALLNREAGLPLNFWGNVRLEKRFTPDAAAILAAGGLMAVSAGIEIATESGLNRLCKGLSLEEIVSACAAFKEAGILVHAYLIFGFWDQDEQEIIDSAEIVRQLFEAKLIDSCFWHKFILTRHSLLYAEKQKGIYKKLKIYEDADHAERFALNDLSFKGENKFDKYSEPLDQLSVHLMSGNTEFNTVQIFPFEVSKPTPDPDLIGLLLDKYARKRDKKRKLVPVDKAAAEKTKVLFLGTLPVCSNSGLFWRWRLCNHKLKTNSVPVADQLRVLLNKTSQGRGTNKLEFYQELESILGQTEARTAWRYLLRAGLVELLI